MDFVLSPGIRLLSRFGFARKFQMLFVLFLLPIAVSLVLLGLNFQEKLTTLGDERVGVRVLQHLDEVERILVAQRNQAARWKAVDTAREPTPATQAAQAALDATLPARQAALAALQRQLAAETPDAEATRLFQALQAAVQGLDSAGLRSQGWWPDGYQRFTAALSASEALREEVVASSGLILDSWLDTYLLVQQGTVRAVELSERLGRLASIGQASVVAGQFSLQSRLQLRDLRERVGDSYDSLRKAGTLLPVDQAPHLREWQQGYRNLLGQLDTALKVLDDGVFGGSITLPPATFASTLDGLFATLDDYRALTLATLDTRLGYYQRQAMTEFGLIASCFVALLLLTCYLLLCLQASIRRSAQGITTLAEGLRDGDLTREVAVLGRDELAAISRALNLAVGQLRTSLQGVERESLSLGVASQQLGVQSGEALSAVESQQAQVAQIATAATELAATAQTVAQSCEQAATRATAMRERAHRSQVDSRQTTASIQQLNARLEETAGALARVNDQAGQIRQVVDVIGGIAEQTNLLALNAAIEAARAGEQGRGFAVVADEVRSLSQRTQASTAQIAETVGSLSSTVGRAVDLMQQACGQAQDDAQAVTGLGQGLEEIAAAVQGVSDTLTQIATAAEQQAATADEVSGNILQIEGAAVSLLGNAQAVRRAAEDVEHGSQALGAHTARFRLQ